MKYNEVTDSERYYISDNSELKKYADDVRFSDAQLEVIRFGLENNIDVSVYAHPDIPITIMQTIFQYLKSNSHFIVRYKEDDNDEEIKTCHFTCHTKQQALEQFTLNHDINTVIDIRRIAEL